MALGAHVSVVIRGWYAIRRCNAVSCTLLVHMEIQVPVFGTFARDSSLGGVRRNIVVTKYQCRLGDEVRKRRTDLCDDVATPFDAYASFMLCSILRIG